MFRSLPLRMRFMPPDALHIVCIAARTRRGRSASVSSRHDRHKGGKITIPLAFAAGERLQ